ncbi:hypothetical protein ACIQBJ_33820 [Kitasatospora sp. NPDC088391]|uniref:hypothetical protein n=1 Tax=Kitasatospora sp. NPDC088391 TaxID=3364074 RepID=UPI00382E5F0F
MQDAILISAAPGTVLPLSLDDAALHLQACFPGVRYWRKHAPVSRTDHLDFETTLDGMTRHGSYFDRSHLVLRDGAPALWAGTIAWFLALLPSGTPTVAMVESNPGTLRIPPGADAQEITDLLTGLLCAE